MNVRGTGIGIKGMATGTLGTWVGTFGIGGGTKSCLRMCTSIFSCISVRNEQCVHANIGAVGNGSLVGDRDDWSDAIAGWLAEFFATALTFVSGIVLFFSDGGTLRSIGASVGLLNGLWYCKPDGRFDLKCIWGFWAT